MSTEEILHQKRVEQYAQKIKHLWLNSIKEASSMASNMLGYDPSKPFNIKNYPSLKKRMDALMQELHDQTLFTITEGIDKEWYYANTASDTLVKGWSKGKPRPPDEWMQHNEEARDSFKLRKEAGMSLSDRVWSLTADHQVKLEQAIDMALYDGKSAQLLSQDVRSYLNEPNRLFRRVRDARGNLQLSKAAKAYHSGQGVYRSSYKNAMRLARTETNMAYRYADFERYNQLDFILGYEVHLSNNHPEPDICDDLKGKYPKTFKYGGWHPHCRCWMSTILADDKEFNDVEDRLLSGEDISGYVSPNAVTSVPTGMTNWADKNLKRSQGWKNQPYFIRDNFKGGNLEGGLQLGKSVPVPKIKPKVIKPKPAPVPKPIVEPKPIAPAKPVKPIKTPEQKAAIQKAWDIRQQKAYSKEVDKIMSAYGNVKAIKNMVNNLVGKMFGGESTKNLAVTMKELRHKVEVKKAWDIRRGAMLKASSEKLRALYWDELQRITMDYGNSNAILEKVISIQNKIKLGSTNPKFIQYDMEFLRKKVQIKIRWDERVMNNRYDKLLVDTKSLKKQFSMPEIDRLYVAVENKLKEWESLSYEDQITKLKFEIKWLEDNQKYPTWKAAQDAYKKRLATVEYTAAKEFTYKEVEQAMFTAMNAKSLAVKQLGEELQGLFNKNAPIKTLMTKSEELTKKVDAMLKERSKKGVKAGKSVGDLSAYSQERKDAAFWTRSRDEADKKFRHYTKKQWDVASYEEKEAAYRFTNGSGEFNRPLRGYANASWEDYNFKGIGNVSLNAEGAESKINALTNLINRSDFPFDVWMQRGVSPKAFMKTINVDFLYMSERELQGLVGKTFTDTAFQSCGVTRGGGFSGCDVIMNIYAPTGTKMIYAEPYSAYGGCSYGKGVWDGAYKTTLMDEMEMTLQRSSTLRITKVEKSGNRFYIDCEVIAQ